MHLQRPLGPNGMRLSAPVHRRGSAVRASALFGWGRKPGEKSEWEMEKDEAFKDQQELLERRRKGAWQDEVKTRRAKVSKYLNDPAFKAEIDAEKRARFKAKKALEDAETPKWGIIVPIFPLGLPDYDEGERFDLRLPYVDNGWVDEDADFGKQVKNFFSFGKGKTEAEAKPDPKAAKGGKPKRK